MHILWSTLGAHSIQWYVVFVIGLPLVSSLTIKGLVKILCLILSCIAKFRVRKYAKFGVFYAKIVQMTPQRLRRESLRFQKFLVNKQGATLTPEIFGNKHSFVLTFFATNTIYVNCKRCKP